jgi:hypothetical protein
MKNLSAVFFFFNFLIIKTLDRDLDSLEMLDPDLYPESDSMKSGSQLWKLSTVL